MQICIIGFGAAGIAALRHVANSAYHYECTVFEQTDEIGGTWVYTDQIGLDKYGLPIHTSMYKNLSTNLPHQIMNYPDLPISTDGISFPKAEKILKYLQQCAKKFNYKDYVKFNHHVKNVTPVDKKWKVIVKDLENNEDMAYTFDAVMVCNGHYHTPLYPPEIPGIESFPGKQMHSHDYRNPMRFKDEDVVLIGAGPSGIDLTLDIASAAHKVILSRHRNSDDIKNVFPENVRMKYEIKKIDGRKVIFDDDSFEYADTLLYCTGYKYIFPFLSDECGIKVEENCVQPLYKHFISIEHPTLSFVGLPYYVCAFSLFDLQVRCFLKVLEGSVKLPSKEEMLSDTENEMQKRKLKGLKKKQFHMMGALQDEYYKELAALGGFTPFPEVLSEVHNFVSNKQLDNPNEFRDSLYLIEDDKTFWYNSVCIKMKHD